MSKLKIEGKHILSGEIQISGAKNSAVALLPAAVLAKKKSIIYNVPEISDIKYLIDIMKLLNVKINHPVIRFLGVKTAFWKVILHIDGIEVHAVYAAIPYQKENAQIHWEA